MHAVLIVLSILAAAFVGLGILGFVALVLPWIVSGGR